MSVPATTVAVRRPRAAINVQRSVLAQNWVRLDSVLVAEYDVAAAVGRRAGVFETARAFLAG
jgi:hypothetical protein